MNLMSNFVGEISASMFGGNSQGITPNIDMNDNTFDSLLEKAVNRDLDALNMPSIQKSGNGVNIGDYDGYSNVEKIDSVKTDINIEKFNKSNSYTTSELLTFYPSIFDLKPKLTESVTNGLYNFERKLAASSYGKGARNIVTDISEFVTDALKIS